jgi:hypothetical protein
MREAGTGALVGMGSRSVRPMYVNGREQDVGYISQLRASPDYRFGLAMARMVARGFAYHRALHADGRTPYYLCSIVEGNEPARRLLASWAAGTAAVPAALPAADLRGQHWPAPGRASPASGTTAGARQL